jgi:ABC-type phosphate/phosphonate transport system substrate-binding protein
VRKEESIQRMDDSHRLRFAYNGNNSLSGYRCLRPLIGDPDTWFDESIRSGGHRRSCSMVSLGEADIAAVDALCWHLFQQHEPQMADGLRVLRWTPMLPGLPYITRKDWSAAQLIRLRTALGDAVSDISQSSAAEHLPVCGFSLLTDESYQSIKLL